MTNSNQTPPSSKRLRLASTALFVAISQLSTSAFAVDRTWTNSSTDFTDTANWGGTAPADALNTDRAIFAAATTTIPSLAANRSINGIDFTAAAGGATLTSTENVILTLGANGIDATGQLTAGTNTVSVANLKIGAAQTWTLFSNTSNTASNPTTFSVSSNIALNGQNLTINPNRNGATGNVGIVNLSGNITGATGANGLIFNGGSAFRNTVNLTGANTYTGKTTIANVTVTANSLADSGTSALGFGDLTLGTLNTNSGLVLTFQNLAADGTTGRLVTTSSTAGSGVVINNNDADNTLAFTNAGNLDTNAGSTSNLLFNLGGSNTGDNVFAQAINERVGTGVTNLTKSGAGKWVLTGNNSHEGLTTISGGTLQIGNGGTSGSLATGSAITNNATLAFNRSDSFTVGNLISGTGAVNQIGTGTTTLTGGNSYSGLTTISAGTLIAGSADAFKLATGQVNVTGGTLDSSVAAANFGGAINLSSGSVNINTNSAVGTFTLAADRNFTASGGTLTFNLGTTFDQIVAASGTGIAKFDLNGSTLALDTTGAGFSYGSSYQLFSGFNASTSVAGTALITGYDTVGFTATLANTGLLSFTAVPSNVPEPSTYAMMAGLGILGFAIYRRRRA